MNELELFFHNLLGMQSGDSIDYLSTLIGAVLFIAVSIYNLRAPSKKEDKTKLEAAPASETAAEAPPLRISFKDRLQKGLSRTRGDVWNKVGRLLRGDQLEGEELEELEEILYTSDLSPQIVDELIEMLKSYKLAENEDYKTVIKNFLKQKMAPAQETINPELYDFSKKAQGLKVIMVVGVNGAGKTTTIGKLATRFKAEGAKVVVGACDTFRAAAVEQLEVWCKRADVQIVKAPENSNPTGVAFDTVKAAKEMGADYCIIDTAGRLHTASNLMDELAKTKKVMSKIIPEAPHETLLVVDAITGQNALRQAREFNASLELSGLVFTKCDGSSKAGSAVSIVNELNVPIAYVGVGEDVEDLDVFKLDDFLNALVGHS